MNWLILENKKYLNVSFCPFYDFFFLIGCFIFLLFLILFWIYSLIYFWYLISFQRSFKHFINYGMSIFYFILIFEGFFCNSNNDNWLSLFTFHILQFKFPYIPRFSTWMSCPARVLLSILMSHISLSI